MQSTKDTKLVFNTREELVYNHLRLAITQGQWGPEEPIVISRVATDLGVSRITISNAIKRLAGEGFVRLTPHKEAHLAPISRNQVEDIYYTRAALESEAAAHACQRATAQDVIELRRLNALIGDARLKNDIPAARTTDKALHTRLRETADMPRLAEMIRNLVDHCEYYRSRVLKSSHLAIPSAEGHEAWLDAMETHNTEQVRAIAREHILGSMRLVLQALEDGNKF